MEENHRRQAPRQKYIIYQEAGEKVNVVEEEVIIRERVKSADENRSLIHKLEVSGKFVYVRGDVEVQKNSKPN